MEGERIRSGFRQSIPVIVSTYNNLDGIDDGQWQERKLKYSTQSIALFVVGGIILVSLISMNLYMNGWRKGCGKRSQSNSEINQEEKNIEQNQEVTQDNIQFEKYFDDDVEMSIQAKRNSIDVENTSETNESSLTRLGRILASYHPKVFDAIRDMSISNPNSGIGAK